MDEKREFFAGKEIPYVRASDGFLRFSELPKEVRLRLLHEEKKRQAERSEYQEKLE